VVIAPAYAVVLFVFPGLVLAPLLLPLVGLYFGIIRATTRERVVV
jgi:hypothetical protein